MTSARPVLACSAFVEPAKGGKWCIRCGWPLSGHHNRRVKIRVLKGGKK